MGALSVQGRMTGISEADEIRAACSDMQAFRPLYERYYRRVLGFVYNRVENKELAFDLTSQVFYEAMQSMHRYVNRGLPFSAWLFRIALNVLGKHFRAGKVRRTVSLNESGLFQIQDECGASAGDTELYRVLQTLNEKEMQLVEMRFFEQRSFSEIAAILMVSESAAKQRLYKILLLLKERLNGMNQ